MRCAPSRRAAIAIAALVCCSPAAAQAPLQPPASAHAGGEPLVLGITLNAEPKGDVFVLRTGSGDILVKEDDFKALGVTLPADTPTIEVDGERHVSLRALGATYTIDTTRSTLAVSLNPQLLPRRVVQVNTVPQKPSGLVPRESSAFLNYALAYADGSAYAVPRIGLTTEAGWRFGDVLALSDAASQQRPDGSRKMVRLRSSITHDDRETLRRWVVGDFHAPARDFSFGANLGGVSFSKLYNINPYLTQAPRQSIRGNVAVPSDLEIFVDGQRVRTERLSPGEFELRDVSSYGGARSVQLVLRDAFGRTQQLNYSLYVSDAPLREGLHEFSYNAGAMRRRFGTDSNAYGTAAYSMFHRYGVTDALTLGVAAEGTRRFFMGGPSVTMVLGSLGILNGAYAHSTVGGRTGAAGTVSYGYEARNWSVSTALRREWGEFATLGEPPQVTNRKYEWSVNGSLSLGSRGTLGFSHSLLRVHGGRTTSAASATQPFSVSALTPSRVTALNYNVPLFGGKVALTASLRHVKAATSRNEAFIGLLYFLDRNHTVNASVRADSEGRASTFVDLTRATPIGEGLGYSLSAQHATDPAAGSASQLRSSLQYNARSAILQAELNRTRASGRTDTEHRAGVTGSVGYAGGRWATGRPVVDSFAIVKVGELSGVTVAVNGQDLGKTDARGELLVPTLRAYYDNEVSIRPSDVPIDVTFDATRVQVSPSLRGGALVNFNALRLQAFTGRMLLAGKPLEHQSAWVMVEGKRVRFITAKGGIFYLENVPPGNHPAEATTDTGRCAFTLAIPKTEETFVDLPDVACLPLR